MLQTRKLLRSWHENRINDRKTRKDSPTLSTNSKHLLTKLKNQRNAYRTSQVIRQTFRFLAIPYHIGWLYGRLQEPRRKNVEASRNYLSTYLELMFQFNSED
jgi:hypothetical protein